MDPFFVKGIAEQLFPIDETSVGSEPRQILECQSDGCRGEAKSSEVRRVDLITDGLVLPGTHGLTLSTDAFRPSLFTNSPVTYCSPPEIRKGSPADN